ncbi:MAG: hypothetical protein H0U66_02730 [Gemmatimonadaceae bacterium]|nr:hypothetical protein [Gemmatimonadaceae bacterium]
MRRALALFALSACVLSRRLDAQQALAQTVALPSGVKVARTCDEIVSEGVLVSSLDARVLTAQDTEYFASLAQTIARRVAIRAGTPPREATYGVLELRDGSFAQRFSVVRSGERELDTSIDGALAISPADLDRSPIPNALPDSIRLLVTFGQHQDGTPFVASHTRCAPVEFPDNPRHEVPLWARAHPRTVTVRGVVTAAGRVDTATALVDDPSDERYAEAAVRAVADMRFVPAEFDGVKVPSPIEIVVPFGGEQRAEEPAAP